MDNEHKHWIGPLRTEMTNRRTIDKILIQQKTKGLPSELKKKLNIDDDPISDLSSLP